MKKYLQKWWWKTWGIVPWFLAFLVILPIPARAVSVSDVGTDSDGNTATITLTADEGLVLVGCVGRSSDTLAATWSGDAMSLVAKSQNNSPGGRWTYLFRASSTAETADVEVTGGGGDFVGCAATAYSDIVGLGDDNTAQAYGNSSVSMDLSVSDADDWMAGILYADAGGITAGSGEVIRQTVDSISGALLDTNGAVGSVGTHQVNASFTNSNYTLIGVVLLDAATSTSGGGSSSTTSTITSTDMTIATGVCVLVFVLMGWCSYRVSQYLARI